MDKIIKQDDNVMKILNVSTIQRIICETDKGTLKLQIRKGDKSYHLILDSVPLDNEKNKELMELLFPVKEMEVPQVNKIPLMKVQERLNYTIPVEKHKPVVTKKKEVKPKKK